jgi:hypothetical protein
VARRPKTARKIIEQIVDNGVEIHIVNINVCLTYGWENDPARSIIVDVELGRANSESKYKSQRIGSAWAAKKREVIATGKFYTSRLPAWLEVPDLSLRMCFERLILRHNRYQNGMWL